jgi:hypothetical protein
MIEFSENGKTELLKAFVSAQAEMDGAKKTASNPAFKSRYADLAAVCDAVMPALTKYGIAVVQSPSVDENNCVIVQTMFTHESGGCMWDVMVIRPEKAHAHGIGSAITYARRYALQAMCGIAPEDDDGNAASLTGGGKQAEKPVSSAQAKRELVWGDVEQKLRSAKTETELDTRAEWFLANNKIPLSWKQLFDDEWERCRNDLVNEQAAG